MKSFYSSQSAPAPEPAYLCAPSAIATSTPARPTHIRTRARVAVYEASGAAPRVEDLEGAPIPEYIESLTARVYELAREQGGCVPYTAIREVSENFIHADFAEPVVSILDGGMTIRFADQGPGIADKSRAVLPGFTTASGDMKNFIRGVGSGLPIVRDYLSFSGGSLVIEDNLGGGSVVTLFANAPGPATSGISALSPHPAASASPPADDAPAIEISVEAEGCSTRPRLSTRQKQVLALVMESGSAGPSLVAKELGVGVSTAYRDLASLEDQGLITSEGGKRTLTEQGLCCIDSLIAR